MEEAGPLNDRRMAVRPAHDDGTPARGTSFLNFAILDQRAGAQHPAQRAPGDLRSVL